MTRNSDEHVTADCVGIVVAAGSGNRAGSFSANSINHKSSASNLKKQFWPLGGKPILAHSFDIFQAHPRIKNIIIVASKNNLADIASRFGGKNCLVVEGGATRQQSVLAGLQAAEQLKPTAPLVAIHDAARPLLPSDLLTKMLATINATIAGVAPALPFADTLASVDAQQSIDTIVDRESMRSLQTPQLFWRSLITDLHQHYENDPLYTDDCGLAVAAGHKIATVLGDHHLLKLTNPQDYVMLQTYWQIANGGFMATRQSIMDIRIGNGFDVHKFADTPGPIMLAGISVDNDRGMLAHSDGDVGLHALCDAIFGALADGDIGHHFPPSDPQWRSANSAVFLEFAMNRVRVRKAKVINLDLTIVCETPKIGRLRDQMRARIAEITKLPIERVAVKATTSEKLGFTGRGEGIAAQATASVFIPDQKDSHLHSVQTLS